MRRTDPSFVLPPKHSLSSEPDSITARVLEANGVAGRERIPTIPSRHVLGMRVDLLSTKEAVSRITNAAESGQAGYCCVTNVHQCIMTYDDPAFRNVVNGAESSNFRQYHTQEQPGFVLWS